MSAAASRAGINVSAYSCFSRAISAADHLRLLGSAARTAVTNPSDGFNAYPTTTIPEEAITSGEFSDYGRLTTGVPFRGTALLALEKWEPCYKFGIPKSVGTI